MRERDWPPYEAKMPYKDGESAARWETLPERDLVFAMRRGDVRALEEFLRRFHPLLLDRARRAKLCAQEPEDIVVELLEDLAVELSSWHTRIPTGLGAYLMGALRNRLTEARREGLASRGQALPPVRGESEQDAEQRITPQTYSEYTIRASKGPDWDPFVLSGAIKRLADRIEEGVSEEELELLMWVANDVQPRQIAEWLRAKPDTARKRIYRLRLRLKEAASIHAPDLSAGDRRELARLIARAERTELRLSQVATRKERRDA